MSTEKIGVIGLGYVGLPLAVGLAARHRGVRGYDRDPQRIASLREGVDATGEVDVDDLIAVDLQLADHPEALAGCTAFIVTVPTPVDANKQPDLTPVRSACETVGRLIRPGGLVVFESTVYPGLTEEICGPLIGAVSGLTPGRDFKLGYSPERINPGDKVHRLETIVKVVSGQDSEALERVAAIYEPVVQAGLHKAPNIRVAEAAKVIENVQRDLNIALINEIALICHRLGIRTRDVLEAAGTKWNFLKFTPGLVGGHCIGVDPYYLTAKAQALDYNPEVILAGRRINDGMGSFIAVEVVRLLAATANLPLGQCRVGILGLTFKENVPDLRNTKVVDIVEHLKRFGVAPLVHDPHASADEAHAHCGVRLSALEDMQDLDLLILAVPHAAYLSMADGPLFAMMRPHGALMDVRSALNEASLPTGLQYWSL